MNDPRCHRKNARSLSFKYRELLFVNNFALVVCVVAVSRNSAEAFVSHPSESDVSNSYCTEIGEEKKTFHQLIFRHGKQPVEVVTSLIVEVTTIREDRAPGKN
ncbi:Oidioi.mRNA.OKI2018_I69.XSR.g16164.t1.cds [Oikopleura dioica]|uniref:Oidioi.mRNA.OKI2018_I69.XSR.g16164.t1.cds n=1 Tax=Oikopleura dioica TaxID=34765 RepID=A0ABN7SJG3_OIKDI|nr:Oidioi.mRNA.OKI2018_I69.XSR.g16164.t1.cds [Oikopleura dioica]